MTQIPKWEGSGSEQRPAVCPRLCEGQYPGVETKRCGHRIWKASWVKPGGSCRGSVGFGPGEAESLGQWCFLQKPGSMCWAFSGNLTASGPQFPH